MAILAGAAVAIFVPWRERQQQIRYSRAVARQAFLDLVLVLAAVAETAKDEEQLPEIRKTILLDRQIEHAVDVLTQAFSARIDAIQAISLMAATRRQAIMIPLTSKLPEFCSDGAFARLTQDCAREAANRFDAAAQYLGGGKVDFAAMTELVSSSAEGGAAEYK